VREQIITESIYARCRERGELFAATGAVQCVGPRVVDTVRWLRVPCPQAPRLLFCGLGDGDDLAWRSVDACPHIDLNRGAVIVGVLFTRERRDVPGAGLIDVIDHPRCFFCLSG
jgi:hypothetical protein